MESTPLSAGPQGGDGSREVVWRGRRAVLGGGFGCVIVLLVFSTVEAYRIQTTVFEQHVDSYKRYLVDEDAVARLRRNTLISSTYARDFFLSGQSDRGAVLERQLGELAAENLDALSRLEQRAGRGKALAGLSALLDDLWRALKPIPGMRQLRGTAAYDFVQREIVPRRQAVDAAALQFSGESQQNFQLRETDLAVRRRLAAQRLATLLGACLILGIVVSWLSLRHVERLAREAAGHYNAALDAKRELQELYARLIDLQEEERRSIARGLHDEIGQTLTALRLEISHALGRAEGGAEVRERLERARALAEKTVRTVRDISLVLRPALLDDLGLVPALEWQIEEFSRRSGVACEFSAKDVEESLPDPVKTCVFRVVQEALNNCEKHAAASKAWASLRQESGCLTVELGDDGRGFQTELQRRRDATGLVGMRERAIRLGGRLVYGSAPGRGTRIVLTIPLADAGAPKQRESKAAEA